MSELLAILREIDLRATVVAVLDVLIVAYVFYRLLVLIRGTRAAYMLIGLAAVAGVFVVARLFDLKTLRWLLDNVLNYLLLIVIIVFQADIRRGLLRMGRRMFNPTRSAEATAWLEELVKAAEGMAARRVGALIVIERESDLDELIQSSTVVDAVVSRDLLQAIFAPWSDNTLHDGAVILRRNRVRRAAAVLPLSHNPNLDRALGTRHRAGVGITEETDAVAVVVSEQRGSISFCVHGIIRMGLTGPALRRELLALLAGEQERPRGLFARAAARFVDLWRREALAAEQETRSPSAAPQRPGRRGDDSSPGTTRPSSGETKRGDAPAQGSS